MFMCVSAQLCDAQGAALFPFVRLPPRVRRPLAGAAVHDMSLTHGERLRIVGCALTGKLVRLLSLGTVALYRLAAAQNLDDAQLSLGGMYYNGWCVAKDQAEGLRLYQLAAAQGHPDALFYVAAFHEDGQGVPEHKDEAIRWYRRAQAAGHPTAAAQLQRLGAR
jgi:hypothetical protein